MSESPFAVLGIAPTTELTALKRGYFAALKLHPPHADPEGFRRVRAAYEALSAPGALAAAWLAAGATVSEDLASFEAEWAAPLGEVQARLAQRNAGATARASFTQWIAAQRWDALRSAAQ